jgi:hypothetical protein
VSAATELPGLHAGALDAYLRALGTMRVSERVVPGLRWSWTERETLEVHGALSADELAGQIAARVGEDRSLLAPVSTPWRGAGGKDVAFRDLRNGADERLLDWFDACAVPRAERDETGSRHNPLLGQGGGFGRSEIADAFEAAVARLVAPARPERVERALRATLAGTALDRADAKAVAVAKKAIGAYQSGRATGPGASASDTAPTMQKATTSAWDLVLVLEGLRAFRGAPTRRSERSQASFPLLARAQAVGLDAANAHQDREEDGFEVLVPLWSAPSRAATVMAVIGRARLRLADRNGPRIADDALEALLSQTAVAVGGLGFDRCVRFALHAPSDPRYRYAVRRGAVAARGSRDASDAARTLLPFVRAQARAEPHGDQRTAAHGRAEHELREALAGLGVPPPGAGGRTRVRRLLAALVALELIASRAHPHDALDRLELPELGREWDRAATRRDPGERPDAADREWDVARALASTARLGDDPDRRRASWLRPLLLPHRTVPRGWRLTSEHTVPDLTRSARPADVLLDRAIRHALRPSAGIPAPATPRGVDVPTLEVLLAAGGIDPDAVARLAAPAARLAVAAPRPAPEPVASPRAWEGATLASVLLASQPADDEPDDSQPGAPHAALARRARLAALARAGQLEALVRQAAAELWSRDLAVPLHSAAALCDVDPCRLALALLVPVDSAARHALRRAAELTTDADDPTSGR